MDDNHLEGLSDNRPDDLSEEFTEDIEEPKEKVVKDFYFISEKPFTLSTGCSYSERLAGTDKKGIRKSQL